MKLAILLFTAFITGMITLSSPVQNIAGTWVMQAGAGNSSPVVIRISMEKGVWVGKMDIPEQQLYNKEVYAITVNGDSVQIDVSATGNRIKAQLQAGNRLTGTIITDTLQQPVQFVKR